MKLQHTIQAVIRPGEQSGYVAECVQISVVTQGGSVDQTIANLREAVALHLQDEDLSEMGLAPNPNIMIAMELEPIGA